MKILAFDTTSQTLSVALLENDHTLSHNTILDSGKQSELLVPEIEKCLNQHNIWYDDLDLIAVTHGPGSFTGSRIGLSVARTIKLANNTPLMLLNSCEVLAHKYRDKKQTIFVLLDARADEFFYAEFSPQNKTADPKLARLDELENILPDAPFFLCGSGKEMAAAILEKQEKAFLLSEEEDIIDAISLGQLAYEKHPYEKHHSQEQQNENLNPLYLRAPRISKRKK